MTYLLVLAYLVASVFVSDAKSWHLIAIAGVFALLAVAEEIHKFRAAVTKLVMTAAKAVEESR